MSAASFHQRTEKAEQLIPPSGYTDPAYLSIEIDQIFSRYWNFAGMTDDVPETGD